MAFYRRLLTTAYGLVLCMALTGCGQGLEQTNVKAGMDAVAAMDYDTALSAFETALTDGESERSIYRGEGLAYLGKSMYSESVDAFEKALAASGEMVDSMDYDINYYLACAYEKNGDRTKAIAVYDAILALKPKDLDALYLRGSLLLKQGDYENACKDFEVVLSLEPTNIDRIVSICELLDNQGYQQIAKEYLEGTMAEENAKKLTTFDLGRIYYYLEDYDNAKTNLEQARDNTNPETALYLGKTYEALGDFNYAASVYNSYLQADAESAEVYNQLGLCKIKQGAYEEALTAFQTGMAIEGNDQMQSLSYNEIVAYEYLEDYKKAAVLMEAYLAKYPDDEAAQREYLFLKTR
ncbi:MAG: tetratricopeptide repeat protein [Lachnospiraceae bacterium]|nr:tetratricopeptide repeat protein [Lachnospiraceae bacterium]